MSEKSINNNSNKKFSFMTNIFVPSHDRTTYVKFLEKYTMDGQVTYLRLIISMLFFMPVTVGSIYLLLNDFDRLKFIVIPILLFNISMTLFGLNFLINSRGESMLSTLFRLNMFKADEVSERRRKNAKLPYYLTNITDQGVLEFNDGRIGMIYEIEGVLSSSTLPSVVANLHAVKNEYLIGRTNTSEEIMLSEISPVDLDRIMLNLDNLSNKASENDNLTDLEKNWIDYMAEAHKDFLNRYHQGREFRMSQYLILIDDDAQELERGVINLTQASASGMFSNIKRVDKPLDIIDKLSTISLLTKRGKDEIFKEKEKEERNKKFRKQ